MNVREPAAYLQMNQLTKIQASRQIIDHLRGIHGIHLKSPKRKPKDVNMEHVGCGNSPGCRPVMPKHLPGYSVWGTCQNIRSYSSHTFPNMFPLCLVDVLKILSSNEWEEPTTTVVTDVGVQGFGEKWVMGFEECTLKVIKRNRKLTTCKPNQLDLGETLGSWPIMPKNLPGHCCQVHGERERERLEGLQVPTTCPILGESGINGSFWGVLVNCPSRSHAVPTSLL